jgi:hypothetical protein
MPTADLGRRRSPRAALDLPVTLARPKGTTIAGRSVDVGLAGMRVCADRPLAIDELLAFEVTLDGSSPLAGRARVLREHQHSIYALNFENLRPDAVDRLSRLVSGA